MVERFCIPVRLYPIQPFGSGSTVFEPDPVAKVNLAQGNLHAGDRAHGGEVGVGRQAALRTQVPDSTLS